MSAPCRVCVVTISEYSDPYEPPLTRIDAIFSSRKVAEKWVELRNSHVDMLIEAANSGMNLDADRDLARRYGFALGCPVDREIFGERHEFFSIDEREVWDSFTGEEYPDDLLWSGPEGV